MKKISSKFILLATLPLWGYLAACSGESDPTPVKSLNIAFSGNPGFTSDSSATLQIGQTLNLNILVSSSDDKLQSMTVTKIVTPKGSNNPISTVLGEITKTRDFDNDRSHTYRITYLVSAEDANNEGPVRFRIRITNTKNGFAQREFLLTVQPAALSIGFLNANGTPGDSVVTYNSNGQPVYFFVSSTGEIKRVQIFSDDLVNAPVEVFKREGAEIVDKKYFSGTYNLPNRLSDRTIKRFIVSAEDATGIKRSRILYLSNRTVTTTPSGGTQHLKLGSQANAVDGSFVQYQDGSLPLVRKQNEATNAANSGNIILGFYKTTDTNLPAFATPGDNSSNSPWTTVFSRMNPRLSGARIKASSLAVYESINHEFGLERAIKAEASPERTSITNLAVNDVFLVYENNKKYFIAFKILEVSSNFIIAEAKYIEKTQ